MKFKLERIKAYIDSYIKECDNANVNALSAKLQSGKMLRSKLLLSIAESSEDALRVCAFIEMIQNASLLHDDVIDNALTRRNEPSINATFGNKNAIMLGDVLYAKAFYELSSFEPKIAKSISNAVVKLSIGEIDDVYLAKNFNSDKMAYIKMCANKTAALIVAAAECGAILKGLNKHIYRIYGENLGIAFQIIDDILDITQDEITLGKPSMSDFKEGKSTLPYILLYHALDSSDAERLSAYCGKELDENAQMWIKMQFNKYNIISQARQEAEIYAKKALEAIANENNKMLESFITQMIDRSF